MAIDLDKLERRVFDYIQECDLEESLFAAIKELKAAREVVEAARDCGDMSHSYSDLRDAVKRYDEAGWG